MAEKDFGTAANQIVSTITAKSIAGSQSPVMPDTSSSNSEVDTLNLVLEKFNIARAFCDILHTRFDTIYKIYMGYAEANTKIWKTNIFVPTGFTVVETLLPKILQFFFAKKFFIKISPREKNDIDMSRTLSETIKYQLHRMGAFNKFYIWIKTTLMYGYGVLKVYWLYDTRKQTVYEPMTINVPFYGLMKVGRRKVKKEITRYDDPDCEVVDIYDFFFPPRAENIKKAQWVIHRAWKPLSEVMANPLYKNKDKLKDSAGSGNQDIDKTVRTTVREQAAQNNTEDSDLVLLYDYWENERNIVIANESIILLDRENPFYHGEKPFVLLKDIEMPHEFVGRGEIEPIKDLILERNQIRSQRLDNMKCIVNKKLIVNRNADIDLDTLDENNTPGGIILTDDVSALRYLEETDIISSSYQEDIAVTRDIQEATATSETAMGMMPRRGETATTINAMEGSKDSRFGLKMQSFAEGGVKDLVEMLVALNAQFLTKKRVIRIVGTKGEEWKEISAEDITMEYDYIPEVGMFQADNSVEKQQWMELVSMLATMGAPLKKGEIIKESFARFNIEDPDRFVDIEAADAPPQMPDNVAAGGTPEKPGGIGSKPGVAMTPGKV